ncbi:hypothetical protein BGX38DRAFT_1093445 [Terfezia claveryi]|nr:hypothetical protein BGX38DRAFT_1093445 [Terfezia claveryi]
MGKASKALREFINGIPDNKINPPPGAAGTIVSDENFRLDMQGLTSGKPQKFNLQVQINSQTSISTIKKLAPKTVATYLTPTDNPGTPAQIRAGLINGTIPQLK